MSAALDEQALAKTFASLQGAARKDRGAFFTPAWLVERVLDRIADLVPRDTPFNLVDPACGAGAFLEPAARRFPHARLMGLELAPDVAAFCAKRTPAAKIIVGDALRGGMDALCLPPGFTLFLGNPPYNGTSSVLKDAHWYPKLRALLPATLPRGTSLRDDFAFFLLKAATELKGREGAIAFVTPSSLLDAFLYAPLRQTLLNTLSLRRVIDLGAGVFEGAQVSTAVTIWTTERGPTTYESSDGTVSTLDTAAPDFLLRPPDRGAHALELEWRERGENLLKLVPISFPGLKTRFDELLVDDDGERLFDRVADFLGGTSLTRFAERWELREHLAKLEALRAYARDAVADRAAIRPFFRYSGAKHRHAIPDDAKCWAYVDRRLIPRGDHRFRGEYDPHACPRKLVFNTRELPLSSAIVETEGCVHAHRHARFAPFLVPQRIREEGLAVARRVTDLGPDVPNLSARGLQWAERVGSVEAVFRAICGFINSADVQEQWAPAYGASRDLHVPVDALAREERATRTRSVDAAATRRP